MVRLPIGSIFALHGDLASRANAGCGQAEVVSSRPDALAPERRRARSPDAESMLHLARLLASNAH